MAGNCSFLTEKKPVCAAVPGVSSQNFLSFPVFSPQISLALYINDLTVQVLYGYLSVNPCKTNRKKNVLVLQHNNAATGDFGCLPTFSRACFEAGLVIKG